MPFGYRSRRPGWLPDLGRAAASSCCDRRGACGLDRRHDRGHNHALEQVDRLAGAQLVGHAGQIADDAAAPGAGRHRRQRRITHDREGARGGVQSDRRRDRHLAGCGQGAEGCEPRVGQRRRGGQSGCRQTRHTGGRAGQRRVRRRRGQRWVRQLRVGQRRGRCHAESRHSRRSQINAGRGQRGCRQAGVVSGDVPRPGVVSGDVPRPGVVSGDVPRPGVVSGDIPRPGLVKVVGALAPVPVSITRRHRRQVDAELRQALRQC